jgi:uncharacterized protein YjiS (DUF1127 family)
MEPSKKEATMYSAASLATPLSVAASRQATAPSLPAILWLWIQRARQRRRLAELDAVQLRDIGVEPEAARREAAKPFWQR